MKLKSFVYASSLVFLIPAANADTLSVTVGGGLWNEAPSGTIQKNGDPATVDLNNDLFFNTSNQGYFFANFEHPVPLLPNIRVLYTNIDHSGSGSSTFTYNGQSFTGNITSDAKIKTLDMIAYYQVLDNVVNLDLGINIRKLDVSYNFTSSAGPLSQTASDSVSKTIPMLYGLIGVSPWPGLTISADVSYLSYSGSKISDITAKIAYTTKMHIGVEAGYRREQLILDNIDNSNASITFGGAFAGAYVKF